MSNILNTIKIKTSRDLIEEPIFLRCDSVRDGAVELSLDAQIQIIILLPFRQMGAACYNHSNASSEQAYATVLSGSFNPGVTITEAAGEERLDVKYGDALFTSLAIPIPAKPYLGPILTPDGTSLQG